MGGGGAERIGRHIRGEIKNNIMYRQLTYIIRYRPTLYRHTCGYYV